MERHAWGGGLGVGLGGSGKEVRVGEAGKEVGLVVGCWSWWGLRGWQRGKSGGCGWWGLGCVCVGGGGGGN